jgi:hypothetical protein
LNPFIAEPPFRAPAFRRDPSGRIIVTGGADGTVRTYRCDLCGGVGELVEFADRRLAGTRRELTEAERDRYLGG